MDLSQLSFTFNEPLTRAEVESLVQTPDTRIPSSVLQRRFPSVGGAINITDLQVSRRLRNCLRDLQKRYGVSGVHDLNRFTIGQLLRLNKFGRKSLIELLSSVLPVVQDYAPGQSSSASVEPRNISRTVTKAAERLRSHPYCKRVHCSDPRFRSEARALLYIANSCSDEVQLGLSATLHEVAHCLVGRARDTSPPERALNAIRSARRKIASALKIPLEKELEEITREFITGRNLNIVLSFFGWSGDGTKTLQTVGEEFKMTRERVRQITTEISKRIKRTRPFAPVLRRTLVQVRKRLPQTAENLELELRRVGLTRLSFRLDGIVSAARLLGFSDQFIIETHHGIRTAVRNEDAGLAKHIIRAARKAVSHAGLGKLGDLCDQFLEETGTSMANQVVRGVLQSLPSLQWLDKQFEWYLLEDVPRNHLVTLMTKVLSVSPSVNVNEMRSAIASDYRGMGFAPPRAVIQEFGRVACNCRIEGDNIVASPPPVVTDVLSKAEQILYSVLAEEGPLLHRNDFEPKCIKRGMNPSTFENYLMKAPILARYAPGVYGLRGSTVTPGDVERCIPPSASRWHDHGWTTAAKPWLAVELSPAALSTGVIAVPSGVRHFIEGRYLLRMPDGSEVGTLVISGSVGWGLSPLFRRRGGEPGDVIILTFDLKRLEAVVRIGTKEDAFLDAEAVDSSK